MYPPSLSVLQPPHVRGYMRYSMRRTYDVFPLCVFEVPRALRAPRAIFIINESKLVLGKCDPLNPHPGKADYIHAFPGRAF